VITQAEALARRASLAASTATAAADAADAAANAAAIRRNAEVPGAVTQHPMVGDPGLRRASKNRQIQHVDRSWEEITQADADAAAQAASAPAAQAAGSTPSGTAAVNKVDAVDVAPPALPGTDAQQNNGIQQDGKDMGRNGDGAGAFDTDGDPSSLSSDSASRATLSTEQSFSVTASASAQTPKSAFTFADTSSNITTSPNDLPNAVPMNNDSEEEDEDALSSGSRSSRARTISSLRSQLAQAIEDKNHAEVCRDSLLDEMERLKTESAIEVSALNEEVGEMRLEAHQLERQLDDALAQRTDEIDQRIQIEKVDNEETL
jgi:hypothetical protein